MVCQGLVSATFRSRCELRPYVEDLLVLGRSLFTPRSRRTTLCGFSFVVFEMPVRRAEVGWTAAAPVGRVENSVPVAPKRTFTLNAKDVDGLFKTNQAPLRKDGSI